MGRYLTPGHTYVDGQTISGPSLTEHVADATLKSTTISDQVLKDPAALTDELLINDISTLKKITIQQIRALILSGSGITPVGGIMDYAGPEAPEGWLLCDGNEVSRETYSVLFEVIGTTWGAGNGTSSFNLPDLRGYVTAGKDDMGSTGNAGRLGSIYGAAGTTLGAGLGEATTTLGTANLPNHAHGASSSGAVNMNTSNSEAGGCGLVSGGGAFIDRVLISRTNYEWGVSVSTTVSGAGSNVPHNTIQATRIVNKIIRYL